MQEARAVKRVVMMVCGDVVPLRVVNGVDSRVCLGAFAKGRSSAGRLNHVLRSCLGWSILGNNQLKQFYIASKKNSADDPSRGVALRDPIAVDLQTRELRKPQAIEKEAETRQELDGIWSLFGAWCVGKQLSSVLVTNSPTFTDWFLALREGNELSDSPLQQGWRCEAVKEFADMISGNGTISFSYKETLHAENVTP